MKVKFCINCFNGTMKKSTDLVYNTDLIYPVAWKNFIQNNSNTPWDFCLLNGGFDPSIFNQYIGSCYSEVVNQPSDPQMTWSGLINGQDYDFTVRCDQDVFITKKWVETIHKFLLDNPEINILSCSNCSQPVTLGGKISFKPQDTIACWGSVMHGDSIVFIKQDLFRKALEEYYINPIFSKNGSSRNTFPFTTNTLTYGEVCKYLDRDPQPYDLNAHLFTSGSIGVDFWTAMCKIGVNHAGICDYNGSCWILKEKLAFFNKAMESKTFTEIIDTRPPTPKYKQVPAPCFHMGVSYLTGLHFNSFNHSWFPFVKKDSVAGQLYGGCFYNNGTFGHWAAHCVITEVLTEYSQVQEFKDLFEKNLQKVFKETNCPEKEYREFSKRIRKFYESEMIEYQPKIK